jgi:predicted ribosomally synthesized peptide with SipW-like signal peptide
VKNKLFVISAAVILLALIAGGTLAWFQYEDTAVNLVTTGSVEVAVGFTQLSGGSEVQLEPNPEDRMMPGSVRSEIVRVRNTGMSSAYIRAKVVKEWMRDGASTGLPSENIVLDINTDDWKTIGDWFYFLQPLERGSSSEPLFNEITFANNGVPGVNDNVYQNTVIRLTVIAEAVQAANNAIKAVWKIDPETWTVIPALS